MFYKYYIFDLYGTLVDIRTDENSPMLWRRTALWYSEHEALWTGLELKKRYFALCDEEQKKHADPLAEIDIRRVFSRLFKEKGVTPTDALIKSTASFFRICSVKKLKLYPWVKPILTKLKENGCGLYLLSNAQAAFTVPELTGLGLSDLLDGGIISSDAGVKKPSPRILDLLLNHFQLEAADCLLVGNDPASDISLAAAAGMDSLYLRTATSPKDVSPAGATRQLLDEDYSQMEKLLMKQAF